MSLPEVSPEISRIRFIPNPLAEILNHNRWDHKQLLFVTEHGAGPLQRTDPPYLEHYFQNLRDGDYFLLQPGGFMEVIIKRNRKVVYWGGLPLVIVRPRSDHLTQEVLAQGEVEVRDAVGNLPEGFYMMHGAYCSVPVQRLNGIWYPRDVDLSIEIAMKPEPGYPWVQNYKGTK